MKTLTGHFTASVSQIRKATRRTYGNFLVQEQSAGVFMVRGLSVRILLNAFELNVRSIKLFHLTQIAPVAHDQAHFSFNRFCMFSREEIHPKYQNIYGKRNTVVTNKQTSFIKSNFAY